MLDLATLTSSFETAFQYAEDHPGTSNLQLASDLAKAVDIFVRGGTVSTIVTGTLPDGPVSASGAGGIS